MSQEHQFKIDKCKYLLALALPYMQTILACDYMESFMRESWIKETCKLLGIEDDGKRHPAVLEMRKYDEEHQSNPDS